MRWTTVLTSFAAATCAVYAQRIEDLADSETQVANVVDGSVSAVNDVPDDVFDRRGVAYGSTNAERMKRGQPLLKPKRRSGVAREFQNKATSLGKGTQAQAVRKASRG